jgi:ribosome-binding factor A
MSRRDDRIATTIAHEAAAFIAQEASTESLITVTRAIPFAHGERYSVMVSVFPEDKASAALAFLERKRGAFSEHLKANARLGPLPRIEFALDTGEQNRQRLDEISGKS